MRSKILIVLLALVTLAGCGKIARQRVLLPAADQVSPRVFDDIELGIADAVEDGMLEPEAAEQLRSRLGDIRRALDEEDRALLVEVANPIIWMELRQMGERGIMVRAEEGGWEDSPDDADSIPEPAESLLLRLETFSEALNVLSERL